MHKVLLVATVQSHIAQFHQPLIKMLKEKGYIVHVCAKNNLKEKNGLSINMVDKVWFSLQVCRQPVLPVKKCRKSVSVPQRYKKWM